MNLDTLITTQSGRTLAHFHVILCASLLAGHAQSVGIVNLHTFTTNEGRLVQSELTVGPDQALYGLARRGGATDGGTFFKLNRDGSGFQVLHEFPYSIPATNYYYPTASLCLATNGSFYAWVSGGLVRINPDGSGFQELFRTPHPDDPNRSLFVESKPIQGRDGALYLTLGAAVGFGTLAKVNLDGGGFQVVHAFTGSPDGAQPFATVIQGRDGTLYGTTERGGTNENLGTVYKVQPDGTGYQVLHSFAGSSDGQNPRAALCHASDGMLYGTTWAGGANGHGTLYMLDTNGGNFQVIHTFEGSSQNDGRRPRASVVQGPDQALYGTTETGAVGDAGTVFRFLPGGSGYSVVYRFAGGSDGGTPYASLTPGPGDGGTGLLYGTTFGTAFALLVNPPLSITPATVQYGTNPPTLFWPSWALNYQLQSTTNLSTGNWVAVTNGVPVSGIRLTNTSPAAYFRLVLP